MSDASPGGNFVFSTLCFLFWAANIGLFGEGGGLAIGLIQLGVFGVYVIVSTTLLSKGAAFIGNTFLVFTAAFGGLGGLTNVGSALAAFRGIPFDNSVIGIPFLTVGCFLLLVMPAARYFPKADFLIFLLGGIGLVCTGLLTLGILPPSTGPGIGWIHFSLGVVAYYSFIAGMLAAAGVNIPLGKPFFMPKSQRVESIS